MDAITQALADPAVRGMYLGFCLALLLVPLILMWIWYRRRSAANTVDRPMLVRIAVLSLAWILVNALALGLLMWAEEANRAAG